MLLCLARWLGSLPRPQRHVAKDSFLIQNAMNIYGVLIMYIAAQKQRSGYDIAMVLYYFK